MLRSVPAFRWSSPWRRDREKAVDLDPRSAIISVPILREPLRTQSEGWVGALKSHGSSRGAMRPVSSVHELVSARIQLGVASRWATLSVIDVGAVLHAVPVLCAYIGEKVWCRIHKGRSLKTGVLPAVRFTFR